MANVTIRLGKKNDAWFTANAAHVLEDGQVLFNSTTRLFKVGDGVTQLSALLWYSPNLAQVLANDNSTGGNDISLDTGDKIHSPGEEAYFSFSTGDQMFIRSAIFDWSVDNFYTYAWIYGDNTYAYLGFDNNEFKIGATAATLDMPTGRFWVDGVSSGIAHDDTIDLIAGSGGYVPSPGDINISHLDVAGKIRINASQIDLNGANINAGLNPIINVPDASASHHPLTKGQFDTFVNAVGGNRGPIDCSANPNYPASNQGDRWEVTVAGKIGGAAGVNVDVYDEIVCVTASAAGDHATVGVNFYVIQGNIERATESTSGYTQLATAVEMSAEAESTKVPSVLRIANWANAKFQTIATLAASVRGTILTGLSSATIAAIDATDSVLSALGKLQAQITVATDSLLNKTNNLSDLTNTTTARTNLGLGDSSTKNVGTAADTVAAGDDSRIKGYALQVFHNTLNPLDSNTYYMGASIQNAVSGGTGNLRRIYIPRAGTINRVDIYFHNTGTVGSSETSTINVRLNGVSSHLVTNSATNDAVSTNVSASSVGLAVAAGDYVCIEWITPAWATNPTQVFLSAVIYVE